MLKLRRRNSYFTRKRKFSQHKSVVSLNLKILLNIGSPKQCRFFQISEFRLIMKRLFRISEPPNNAKDVSEFRKPLTTPRRFRISEPQTAPRRFRISEPLSTHRRFQISEAPNYAKTFPNFGTPE